jgi:hypothetical protein
MNEECDRKIFGMALVSAIHRYPLHGIRLPLLNPLSGSHTELRSIIFALGWLSASLGNYTFLVVWAIGAMGFFLWQLLYVIPLIIWLQRRTISY